MSNKGKEGRKVAKEVKEVKKKSSRSEQLALKFPVGRIGRLLKNGRYAKRIGATAPVCIAAILEYLCVELLDACGHIALEEKRLRIIPRDLLTAIKDDDVFKELFKGVTIAGAGVIGTIHQALLPKPSAKKSAESQNY